MLYLIGGENQYESWERVNALKDKLAKEKSTRIESINADEAESANEILDKFSTPSLFGEVTIPLIKRLLKNSKKTIIEKVADYLDKIPESTDVIFWEASPFDKRTKFYKLIKKVGIVEEYKSLKPYQLKSWLREKAKALELDVEAEAEDELVFRLGADQARIFSELEKVKLYLGSKSKVNKDLVRRIVAETAELDIWEFIDALATRKKEKAIKIMNKLLRNPQDFVMLIGMIGRQLRILTQIRYLLDKGHSENLYQKLGLHPFVAKKAIQQAEYFTLEKLKILYQKLVNADLAVKQGRLNERMTLSLFIAAV